MSCLGLLNLFARFTNECETREHWQRLCELAADEQDHQKLFELVREINDLLEAQEKRLQRQRKAPFRREHFDFRTLIGAGVE